MKWLIILGLFLLIGGYLAVRYRRQIQMGIYVFKMFRKMRQMSKAGAADKKIEKTSQGRDIPLVRCAKCGAWKPQTDALKLAGNIFYCSANCMEKAVEA